MNYIRQTIAVTDTGAQTPIAMDWRIAPFTARTALIVPGGTTASLTVEYTLDDVNNTAITPVWIADATYGTVTATEEVLYAAPIQWIRVVVGSISGGPAYFQVLQATQPQ